MSDMFSLCRFLRISICRMARKFRSAALLRQNGISCVPGSGFEVF